MIFMQNIITTKIVLERLTELQPRTLEEAQSKIKERVTEEMFNYYEKHYKKEFTNIK
jgi:hypothetical protein